MFPQLNDAPDQLPLLDAPRAKPTFVDSTNALAAAIRELATGTGPLAVDAERASGFKYSQRAYLIQLHRSGTGIFLIDPIAFGEADLKALATFTNSQEWILHAATQDMPCLAELGLHPKTLFDTELISRLLGFERVGLGAVCELALKVRLAKEHSAADWSTRPLPESWLNYAALDVDVLPEMRTYLIDEIEAQNKGHIVAQEMEHLLSFKPKSPKADRWRGMSNFHDLREPRQLAIAKALWEAREALAQKLDVSPGRLVPDSSVVHAAKVQPRSKSVLANDKSFNGRASRSYLDTWWAAIEAGEATRDLPPMRISTPGIPNHRNWPAKFPEAHARLLAAKEVIAALSQEIKIPAENLLSPDTLRHLCFEPEGLDADSIAAQLLQLGAREWQIDLVAAPISQAWKDAKLGQTPTA
jgi:ribonuclease D